MVALHLIGRQKEVGGQIGCGQDLLGIPYGDVPDEMDVEEVRTRFVMFFKAETVSDLGVSLGGAPFMLNAWHSIMTRLLSAKAWLAMTPDRLWSGTALSSDVRFYGSPLHSYSVGEDYF